MPCFCSGGTHKGCPYRDATRYTTHMGRSLLPLPLLLLLAFPAVAHTLPKAEFTRRIEVELDPAGVSVRYTILLSDESMLFDGYTFLTPEDTRTMRNSPQEAFARWYLTTKGERIAKSFFARLDDADLTFRLVEAVAGSQDHNRQLRYLFRAEWPNVSPAARHFEFTDDTQFVGKDGKSVSEDADGAVKLTVTEQGSGRFAEFDADDPPERLHVLRSQLKPDEEPLRRQGSATFKLKPGPPAEVLRAAVAGGWATVELPAGLPELPATPNDRGVLEQFHDRGLKALLDSKLGIGLLLVLSALFGAAHAFTPGHGKTMVAAYLVGERGTVWHAVTLGITTTAAHTGSVILVAVGLFAVYGNTAPATAQGWLMLAGGLFIFGVGT